METTLWTRYPNLVEAVRQDHINQGATGGAHDFVHAMMVAQYAAMIAEDERTGELAWIAAICHNTDRLFPDEDDEGVSRRVVRYLVNGVPDITVSNGETMMEAVLTHHKLNDDADNPVTVTLKDADRLANIGPNLIIRAGQHYHELPAFDPQYLVEPDPEATYRNPKTVLHDILCALEWEPWLRLPKAQGLAKPYFDFLREFHRLFSVQMEELELVPYPFPEDLDHAYGK